MSIPKILHQIWIGPKPMPSKFMNTFRDKHPDFEYIRWTETEMEKRGLKLECGESIERMSEINGKADIIRWEILYQYGGIFQDADSVCLEPFDDIFLEKTAFAGFENETARAGLVATGTMGFPPKHPLCRAAIDWMLTNDTCPETCGKRAWYTVGPGLLTRLLETGKYPDFSVFPSYSFIPYHFTGLKYEGHKKVYCFQEWGSTKQNYEIMNQIEIPDDLKTPGEWVSVLVSSYNTKYIYIKECLESIKSQTGHFGIELVWINDGSDDLNSRLLERELDQFTKTTRFTKVVYERSATNRGIAASLYDGIQKCSHELIIKMDSDDVMFPDRIQKQLDFMRATPDCVMCGTDLQMFQVNPHNPKDRSLLQRTNHPTLITWDMFRQRQPDWFANHPTLCYKKSAILAVGNYDITMGSCLQDYEIELRILKKYGKIYNIPEVLLYYRIHGEQVTFNGNASNPENKAARDRVIRNILAN
jgi:GT2 family glycosyltransferase